MAKTRQRGKSYNDIKRQIARITSGLHPRVAQMYENEGYNLPFRVKGVDETTRARLNRMGKIAKSYLKRTRDAAPKTRKLWNGVRGGYDLVADTNYKVDRATRSGMSDADAYANELRRSKRIPDSEHANSEKIRKGGIETLKKYVSSRPDKTTGKLNTKFNWGEHCINEVFQDNKGRYWANVYWQGDSTDGDEQITLDELERGKTIPAEHYFDGRYTRERHGDLEIEPSEIKGVMKAIADKEREEEDRRYAQKLIDTPRAEAPKPKASSRAEYRARRRAQGLSAG